MAAAALDQMESVLNLTAFRCDRTPRTSTYLSHFLWDASHFCPPVESCHRVVTHGLEHNTTSPHRSINEAGTNEVTERRWMKSGRLAFVPVFTLWSALPGSQSTHSLWGTHTHIYIHSGSAGQTINLHHLAGHVEFIICFDLFSVLICSQSDMQSLQTGGVAPLQENFSVQLDPVHTLKPPWICFTVTTVTFLLPW